MSQSRREWCWEIPLPTVEDAIERATKGDVEMAHEAAFQFVDEVESDAAASAPSRAVARGVRKLILDRKCRSLDVDPGAMKKRRENSFDPTTHGNWCVFESLVPSLPSERTLYLLYWSGALEERLIAPLEEAGLQVLDATPHLRTWSRDRLSWRVSRRDGHPSAGAHKVFAEILFSRIVSDARFGFASDHAERSARDHSSR